jgi:hypothetical protein
MPRRRWVQVAGELIEVSRDYVAEPRAPMIFGDLPGYESPVTGQWIEGRRARREDLKRTGCRPWEGLAAEKREAARQRAYEEIRQDRKIEEAIGKAWAGLSVEKRELLRRA